LRRISRAIRRVPAAKPLASGNITWAPFTGISRNAHLYVKTPAGSRGDASISQLDEHGPMHTHDSQGPKLTQRTLYCKVKRLGPMRTGGAKRMNAGLVCGQQAQGRLQGEAR
jgi:hypothetical protein